MPRVLKLRTPSAEEEAEIRRLAGSRKEAARLVQRAQIVRSMLDDPSLTASEAGLHAGFKQAQSGIGWVKRFNAEGVVGLLDRPRSGHPLTHDETTRSKVISLALQKPRRLGYPFELWTLERLQAALQAREGLTLGTSTLWKWLAAEGLEWKRQQSWFHDAPRHDPEFVDKRGRLSRPIRF